MLIDVYVNRVEEDDIDKESEYLAEPTNSFAANYKLLMASTLVDINKATAFQVQVLYPFSHPVSLRQDAIIGKAEKIENEGYTTIEKKKSIESEILKKACVG
jgi:hypothetical protein